MTWQKFLYGALFTFALPGLLILWAVHSEVAMPVYGTPLLGSVFAAFGLGLMLAGMLDLWRLGGGLPMNAFPPPNLVSSGTFSYLPHPIYTGFVGLSLGISMLAKSSSGLWLVTPSVTLGCLALVLGYERPDLGQRLGRILHILPADDETKPSTAERIRFVIHVLVPWLALYEFTIKLPVSGTRFAFGFETYLPIFPWTAIFYESTYFAVVLAPWSTRTRKDLRQLMISAWIAMLVVFPFYWFVPSIAPRPPLAGDNWVAQLLRFERTSYPPVAAFPSFHVLWTILVARFYRPRWLGCAYVIAVSVSCITTGMHYIADVVSALLIAPVLLEPHRPWSIIQRATERLANSWREWRFGPLRIINYALYGGAAGMVEVAVVMAAAGPGREWKVIVIGIGGLVGAGAWAQWVEGSSRLRRPFGFYGGLIGVGIACLFFRERWILLAACCLGAPWMQAIGRVRCLVNGCCHGRPTTAALGIRVSHERSRVARLAELAGIPIHATPLYSILSNIILGLLLMRLWVSGCPLSLISGIYAIGNGISRFIEEAYRGEPQTPTVVGLRLYQWLALATVIIGAVLTTLSSPPPPPLKLSLNDLALAMAFGCVAAAAMGVDLPESNRPLARLT